MIIFQILAGILLLPLTILMLILFHVYLVNWIYLIFIALFVLIYAALCSLLFHSFSAGLAVFIILTCFYLLRMAYLAYWFHAKVHSKNYPALRGRIKSKNYFLRAIFFFPLSFLVIFKLLPNAINQELTKQIGHEIDLAQLIDLILENCMGTRIEVNCEQLEIYFDIQ